MTDVKLRPAFFYALRNTVVARTMDRAAEIAYARDSAFRKVVTLKVRRAGTLTCVQNSRRDRIGTSMAVGMLAFSPLSHFKHEWVVPLERVFSDVRIAENSLSSLRRASSSASQAQ